MLYSLDSFSIHFMHTIHIHISWIKSLKKRSKEEEEKFVHPHKPPHSTYPLQVLSVKLLEEKNDVWRLLHYLSSFFFWWSLTFFNQDETTEKKKRIFFGEKKNALQKAEKRRLIFSSFLFFGNVGIYTNPIIFGSLTHMSGEMRKCMCCYPTSRITLYYGLIRIISNKAQEKKRRKKRKDKRDISWTIDNTTN